MYIRKHFNRPNIFYFKRWSRKNYAVFNSLNRVINIGRLVFTYTMLVVPLSTVVEAQEDTLQTSREEEIDEIVVSEEAAPDIDSDQGRIISVISEEARQTTAASGIPELLEQTSTVDIRQRGPFGVQADMSIRGGSFDQSMVLLNGMNITDPQTGHYSLNLPLSLQSVERVEILKGAGAKLYGSNAYAGAVNFITRPADSNRFQVNLSGGQHQYYNGSFSGTYHFRNTSHFIAGGGKASAGYMPNTDFQQTNFFYHGNYHSEGMNIQLQAGHNRKAFGANRFYTPTYPDQYDENRTSFAGIQVQTGQEVRSTIAAYWRRHHDHFVLVRDKPELYQNYHRTDVLGAHWRTRLYSALGTTKIGANPRYKNILSNNLGKETTRSFPISSSTGLTYHKYGERLDLSVFVSQHKQLGPFHLSAGLMVHGNSAIGDRIILYPGMDIRWNLAGGFNWYASYNKSFRNPTFTDLYYTDPENKGNPELNPSQAYTYETGFQYRYKRHDAHISLFYRDGDNVIDWNKRKADTIWRARNITQLSTKGMEVYYMFNLPPAVAQKVWIKKAGVSYLYQTIDKRTGPDFQSKYATDKLNHKLLFRLTHRIFKRLEANWTAVYQDRAGSFQKYRPSDKSFSTFTYDPFWLIHAKLQYLGNGYNAYVQVSNLLDRSYYDIGNVVQPGRWLTGGIRMEVQSLF